jgi:phage shock protein A
MRRVLIAAAASLAAAHGFIVSAPLTSGSGQRSLAEAARRPARVVGMQMNLADRFFRVAKANLNTILQKVEDPEKVLEQALNDMQGDLIKVRQSYAEVTATQKRMERQKAQADGLAEEWYKRAQLALEKGDEELAREALTRRQQQVDTSSALSTQMETQGEAMSRLYSSMQQLETRITEAKGTKDQLIARARTAKTTQSVNDMLGSVGGSSALEAFERMQQKVESLEASAEVSAQLTGGTGSPLEDRFRALEGGSAVDDELAKLKNLLPGSSSETKALPGALEDELAQMKKELGKE